MNKKSTHTLKCFLSSLIPPLSSLNFPSHFDLAWGVAVRGDCERRVPDKRLDMTLAGVVFAAIVERELNAQFRRAVGAGVQGETHRKTQ